MAIERVDDADSAISIEKLRSLQATGLVKADGLAKGSKIVVKTVYYDWQRHCLYYGLENGEVHFAKPKSDALGSQPRYIGSHKGAITCIATTNRVLSKLVSDYYIITASVDYTIKIWEYLGKLLTQPATCIQTVYGHQGAVTALVCLGDYIISGSTDATVRIWKAQEDRQSLAYPWFELHATFAMAGWVTCMHYNRVQVYEDPGAVVAADETGSVLHIVPTAAVDPDDTRRSVITGLQLHGADDTPEHTVGSCHPAQPVVPPFAGFAWPHDRSVKVVSYDSRSKLVVTLSYDGYMRVFDSTTRSQLQAWANENGGQFTGVAYSHEHNEIVASDDRGYLYVYSLHNAALSAVKRLSAAGEPITAITKAVARQVYAVLIGAEFELWRIDHDLDYNMIRCSHERSIVCLQAVSGGPGWGPGAVEAEAAAALGGGTDFGGSNYRIFSAALDNTVRVWDPRDLKCVQVIGGSNYGGGGGGGRGRGGRAGSAGGGGGPMPELSAMVYFESWDMLVTGHDNGELRLWDVDTGRCTAVLTGGHSNSVTGLVTGMVDRNLELVMSVGFDGQLVFWDVRRIRGEPPQILARVRAAGAGAPGGGAAPGSSHLARLGSQAAGRSMRRTLDVEGTVDTTSLAGLAESLAPSPLGGLARRATLTRTDSCAAGSSTMPPLPPPGCEPEILCVVYDPDKLVVVTGGADRLVRVWSGAERRYLGRHVGHSEAVTALALDANLLFSASEDLTIRVWDLVPAGYEPGAAAQGTVASSSGLSAQLSSGSLASASGRGAAAAAAVAAPGASRAFTSQALRVLSGVHTECITGVAMLPDTGWLASCGLDGVLVYWDYVTGEVREKYEAGSGGGSGDEFRCLAVRFDRREVLVGTGSANILRYYAGTKAQQAATMNGIRPAALERRGTGNIETEALSTPITASS